MFNNPRNLPPSLTWVKRQWEQILSDHTPFTAPYPLKQKHDPAAVLL
jgi:hypothetical protein